MMLLTSSRDTAGAVKIHNHYKLQDTEPTYGADVQTDAEIDESIQIERKKKKHHKKRKHHDNDDGFSGAFEQALSDQKKESSEESVPACTSIGCKTDTAGKNVSEVPNPPPKKPAAKAAPPK